MFMPLTKYFVKYIDEIQTKNKGLMLKITSDRKCVYADNVIM